MKAILYIIAIVCLSGCLRLFSSPSKIAEPGIVFKVGHASAKNDGMERIKNEEGLSVFVDPKVRLSSQDYKKIELGKTPIEKRILYTLGITLNAEGEKKFLELTKSNLNQHVVIYLDHQFHSAPKIKNAYVNGVVVIGLPEGTTESEANALVEKVSP